MQSSNQAETSGQQPFSESDITAIALAMQQHIEQGIGSCHQQIQSRLAAIWEDTGAVLASLPQRVVSDHVSMEDPAGLPYYHPLHWFRSQFAFPLPGILEFTNTEAATSTVQDILNQLQPDITAAIAAQQSDIVETLDRHIHDLRRALVPIIQSQLSNPRIIVTEYINSDLPLPQLQLSEVDRFGFFLGGKRLVPSTLAVTTTKTVKPWYFLGLQQKQLSSYQVSIEQLQAIIQESLNRSFENIKTKINEYINHDLQTQIQRLLASVE